MESVEEFVVEVCFGLEGEEGYGVVCCWKGLLLGGEREEEEEKEKDLS